jgi:hypothetical protein
MRDKWERNSRNTIDYRHKTCKICKHQVDLDHAEALVEEMFRTIDPNETLPTVAAVIAAEAVTEFEIL